MTKPSSRLLALVIVLFVSALVSAQVPPATPVTIDFNELPNGTLVTNQYLPKVYFSATNFRAGAAVSPFGQDLYALSYPGPFDINKSLVVYHHGCQCTSPRDSDVFISFTVPVNNLRFNILNFYSSYSGYMSAWIDVYRNGAFYGYVPINGTYGQNVIPVTQLQGITDITDIRIYYQNNLDPFLREIPMYFDDFNFTPDMNINISNSHITGPLHGTTQKALLGADIVLDTTVSPNGRTGGQYLWTITGPFSLVSGTDSSTLVIRATDPGTGTAKVTYTLNGFKATAQVTINAILPTLTSFTGTSNVVDQVTRDQYCGNALINGVRYSFGCWHDGGPDTGVIFSANVQVPSGPYLTDLSQSGIKIKQFTSKFIKRVNATPPHFSIPASSGAGNIQCTTSRSSESGIDSGWAVDAQALSVFVHPPPRFDQGTSIQAVAFAAPADSVDSTSQQYRETHDTFFADDRFQTYVYYFVGNEQSPIAFQRPLKLSSQSSLAYSYIGWKRNGQTLFDWSQIIRHRLLFSNTPSLFSSGTNATPVENPLPTSWGPCPSDNTTPSTNQIDGSRCFVFQQYWDFLNRAPDVGGWNFWRTQIANCLFDRACIASQRTVVAYEFFRSGEFQQTDPNMANPPGSPNFNPATYNPAFVRHCYENFLRRQPEPNGLAFWVNVLNGNSDYLGVVGAFSSFPEYRNRQDFHTCPSL